MCTQGNRYFVSIICRCNTVEKKMMKKPSRDRDIDEFRVCVNGDSISSKVTIFFVNFYKI